MQLTSTEKEGFRYCPNCKEAGKIYQTDYELEDGSADTNGRGCEVCNWEGSVDELVCLD